MVFAEASRDDRMIVVKRGELRYTNRTSGGGSSTALTRSSSVPSLDANGNLLTAGDWCSEAALWTDWVHFGRLRATHDSEVLVIDSGAFGKETLVHYKVGLGTMKYASGYVQRLNDLAALGVCSDFIPKSLEYEPLDELASQVFHELG